jgi:hypothetical protein
MDETPKESSRTYVNTLDKEVGTKETPAEICGQESKDKFRHGKYIKPVVKLKRWQPTWYTPMRPPDAFSGEEIAGPGRDGSAESAMQTHKTDANELQVQTTWRPHAQKPMIRERAWLQGHITTYVWRARNT